jgi:hypothetical protein
MFAAINLLNKVKVHKLVYWRSLIVVVPTRLLERRKLKTGYQFLDNPLISLVLMRRIERPTY